MDCSCPIASEVWNYSEWSSVASFTSLCCCRRRSCVAVGGLFTGSWVTTIGSKTSSLPGSIFAEWHLPEVGPFTNYAVPGNYIRFPAQSSALASSKSALQNLSNISQQSYIYRPDSNLDLRLPEPSRPNRNHTVFQEFS